MQFWHPRPWAGQLYVDWNLVFQVIEDLARFGGRRGILKSPPEKKPAISGLCVECESGSADCSSILFVDFVGTDFGLDAIDVNIANVLAGVRSFDTGAFAGTG
jgi:hypothetical protein